MTFMRYAQWACKRIYDGLALGDRPVPARYVRHGQMCPQLDVSDKNDQQTQDMSDKARFVRQK